MTSLNESRSLSQSSQPLAINLSQNEILARYQNNIGLFVNDSASFRNGCESVNNWTIVTRHWRRYCYQNRSVVNDEATLWNSFLQSRLHPSKQPEITKVVPLHPSSQSKTLKVIPSSCQSCAIYQIKHQSLQKQFDEIQIQLIEKQKRNESLEKKLISLRSDLASEQLTSASLQESRIQQLTRDKQIVDEELKTLKEQNTWYREQTALKSEELEKYKTSSKNKQTASDVTIVSLKKELEESQKQYKKALEGSKNQSSVSVKHIEVSTKQIEESMNLVKRLENEIKTMEDMHRKKILEYERILVIKSCQRIRNVYDLQMSKDQVQSEIYYSNDKKKKNQYIQDFIGFFDLYSFDEYSTCFPDVFKDRPKCPIKDFVSKPNFNAEDGKALNTKIFKVRSSMCKFVGNDVFTLIRDITDSKFKPALIIDQIQTIAGFIIDLKVTSNQQIPRTIDTTKNKLITKPVVTNKQIVIEDDGEETEDTSQTSNSKKRRLTQVSEKKNQSKDNEEHDKKRRH